MSDTVDRRVVEMRFDNQDFEKNVQSTMSALDKLKQRLNFSKTEQSFGSSASGLVTAVDSVKNRFSALEVIGVTALANITNSAVNLGKHLAKSLTIDQVKSGFSEYELKMGSIQTIMASTGADLDYVNKKLNELNTYSDRTIYSFSDMTNSIGKFTNAGVSLDDAVAAIQGISNEAAVSGANAQEASRAMYNFAQALSAGYVKLIDWKSIENANMATVEFKQQLIDSAVAAGTLQKQMDGTYKVLTSGAGGGFKETISATKNFNDSLSAAWMTTEVLTGTLAKYADSTTDIGKKAFAAAQDVKTFTQLLDTIKESIGSGWAQTFEIIFGNLEEAKKLWTSVNNVVSGFVSASSDARNTILQTWKDLGGREDIANGLRTAFGALRDAYKEAFPAPTTKQLEKVGKKLKEITEGFAKSMEFFVIMKPFFIDIFTAVSDTVGLVKDAFVGLFHVLGGGASGGSPVALILSQFIQLVAAIARGVSFIIKFVRATGVFEALGKILSGLNYILHKVVYGIHTFLLELRDLADGLYEPLQNISDAVYDIFDSVDISKLDILEKVTTVLGKSITFISNGVSKLVKGITSINLSGIGGLLAGGGIFTATLKFSKLIDSFLKKGEDVKKTGGGIISTIKDTFGALTTALESFSSAIKATVLKSIATAILELAIAMKILASIDSDKLGDVLFTVATMFAELGLATKALLGVTAGGSIKQLFILSGVLSSLSKSLVLMAVAAKVLSTMDWNELAKGLAGIGGILFELKIFMGSMAKTGGASVKGAVGLAAGVYILAKALQELAKIDKEGMERGLGAMAAILGMLGIFTNIANPKGMIQMGIAMIFISTAVGLLAKAVDKIGKIKTERLKKGLLGMAGALGAIAIAMRVMPNNGSLMKGLGLIVVAKALEMLSGVLKQIGGIPIEEIKNGLKGIGIVLAEVVLAMNLAKGSLGGAVAMIAAAAAIKILAVSLKLISGIDPKRLAISLFALAGSLAAIMVAGALASSIAVGLLALGGAVLMIGAGAMAAGAGVLMLSSGLSLLVGMADVTLPVIVSFLTSLIELIPIFMKELGKGFISLIEVLTDSYSAFVKFGTTILTATIDGFLKVLPKFVELIGVLIDTFSTVIVKYLPKIVDTGIQLIFAFLDGVTSAMPDLVDKAFKLIITFINSMASAIDKNGDKLKQAFVNLIVSILKFIGKEAVNFFKKGVELLGKLKDGFVKKKDELVNKVKEIIQNVKNKIDNFVDDFKTVGKNLIQGLWEGIKSIPVVGNIASLGESMISKFKSVLGIASPSKVFKKFGVYITQGLAQGLDLGKKYVRKMLNDLISMMEIEFEGNRGVLLKFFDATTKEAKNAVNSVVDCIKKLGISSTLVSGFTKNYTNDFGRSSKKAKKALSALSKELYISSDAYKEAVSNIKNYNQAIKSQQNTYDGLNSKISKLEKERKKASSKRKKEIDKEIKDLKQQKKEVLGNIKDLSKGLKQELKNIVNGPKEAYKEYRNNLKDLVSGIADITNAAVNDYINLFEKMEETEKVSVNELLKNMQSQVVGVAKWNDDLDKLAKRGIADGLLEKLKDMGPEGAKYVQAFLKMTKAELDQANTMFKAEGELASENLLDSMRRQMSSIKTWSKNITELSKRGLQYDFLKDLVDKGPDNADYVQALVDMTDEQLLEASQLYVKNGKLPGKVADNVLAALGYALRNNADLPNGVSDNISSAVEEVLAMSFDSLLEADALDVNVAPSAEKVAEKAAEGVEEGAQKKTVKESVQDAGFALGAALSVGIEDSKPSILNASQVIGDAAVNEFKKYFSTSNGSDISVQITNGLVTGLDGGKQSVADAARELAIQAYNAMKEELGIHSPSKKMAELGGYSMLGFAEGLVKNMAIVSSRAKQAGDMVFNSLKQRVDDIPKEIGNPVIKPVLDLSDINRKAGAVNDLFANSRISVGANSSNNGVQNSQISFVQNNYSPKALSRIDIYRDTRNQLSKLKGVVNRQ